jgi:hypothetical protein
MVKKKISIFLYIISSILLLLNLFLNDIEYCCFFKKTYLIFIIFSFLICSFLFSNKKLHKNKIILRILYSYILAKVMISDLYNNNLEITNYYNILIIIIIILNILLLHILFSFTTEREK